MFSDQFWNFRSDKLPVTSVYINRTDNPTTVSARLGELVRNLRDSEQPSDHAAAMSLRDDLDAISALKDRIETEHAAAVAIFSCSGESFFEYMPLADPARDVSVVGATPYYRPLRAARNSARSAVAIVDKRNASIYIMNGYGTNLELEINAAEESKANYGGWHGYAERKARSHAEKIAHQHFQETADALFTMHKETPIDHVIVGGHAQDIDEFVDTLHPYLRHVFSGSFVVDLHGLTPAIVTDHAMPIEDASRDASEEQAVSELLDTVGVGNPHALGLVDVIKAANVRAIEKLIVCGPFVKDGTVCDACGWLARVGATCAACDAPTRDVPDVVSEVIEATLAAGGSVQQVAVASQLDMHGIGAHLRFNVPESL